MAKHSRALLVLDPGQAPHVPTPASRELVAGLVACGLDVAQIAFMLKCTPFDVEFHYVDELEHGLAMCNAQVGASILRQALKGDMVAAKFWMGTRAKWVVPTKVDPVDEAKTTDAVERKKIMDAIVTMVAREKVKEEAAQTLGNATPGSRRMQ